MFPEKALIKLSSLFKRLQNERHNDIIAMVRYMAELES